jgi:hypothetical protein
MLYAHNLSFIALISIVLLVADTSYSYHPAIHDDTFVRRKQRRNRTTFTLQQVRTFRSSYSSSSSSIFRAGGNPAYHTSAFVAVFTVTPVLVPRSSPEALHARRRERPLLEKGGIMVEKWPVKFSQ